MQVMALVSNQRALIFQERACIFAAGPVQRQSHGSRVYPTGYSLSAGILTFGFLSHPGPTALYFRPLRQTGTALATGVRFGAESPLFQRAKRRRGPVLVADFAGQTLTWNVRFGSKAVVRP
jgi:hypothetical protein